MTFARWPFGGSNDRPNPTPDTASGHTIREELWAVVVFVGVIWGVFLLNWFLPLERWGLEPRRLSGLPGIVAMTFLHADLGHLLKNTVPLLILLALLAGSRVQSWRIVALIVVLGGGLLWLVGRPGIHIGASLLITGLTAFLIASGLFFEKRPVPLIVALVVGFLYGIPVLLSVLPRFSSTTRVSWDGHLCGVIAGVIVAFLLARSSQSGRTASQIGAAAPGE